MRPLWDHQIEAIDKLRKTIGSGIKRVVVSAPTGSGKTLLSAAIVDSALKKDKKVAFVVPAISLVDQTLEAFTNEGIPVEYVGIIQADHPLTDWSRPVQICSISTIRNRLLPEADIVIFDECHVLHKTHKDWMAHERFKDVPFIGLSATPYTKGLGKYFDTKISVATTQELIEKGLLSSFRVFATGHPNLKGVRITAGDYNQDQLSQRMQEGDLTADIVKTWESVYGRGKGKTFVFAVDRAHAKQLQNRFNEAGIKAGYQDANTPRKERQRLKEQFHSGEIDVLTNVGTLTTGVDYDVRCLVLARPTRSDALFQQICGRALRTAEGKDYALILDHSDTTSRLGFVTDVEARYQELDDGKPKEKATPRDEALPKVCPKCSFIRPRKVKICPNCGFEAKPAESDRLEKDGNLFEITRDGLLFAPKKSGKTEFWSPEQRKIFMAELKAFALEKGRKMGWASHAYKKKFGVWPDAGISVVVPANEVGTYTRGWCKRLDIAWFNSQDYRNKVNAGVVNAKASTANT